MQCEEITKRAEIVQNQARDFKDIVQRYDIAHEEVVLSKCPEAL